MRVVFTLIILLTAIPGCGDDELPVSVPPLPIPPTLSGVWHGSDPNGFTFTIRPRQERFTVTGTGTLLGIGGQLSGNVHFPRVDLVFTAPGYVPVTVGGTFVTKSSVNVVLNSLGINNYPLTLRHQ